MRVELTTELQAGVDVLRIGARCSKRRVAVMSSGFAVEVSAESSAFEEAMVWRGWLVVGFGDFVHLVNVETREAKSIALDSYFGSFHALDEALLVASGTRVQCINPNGVTRWTSEVIAIDGVIINAVNDDTIDGSGEWDPPGGWRPFQLSMLTGLEKKAAGRSSEF